MNKRKELRKQKKQNGTYSWKHFLGDVFLAVPELLVYAVGYSLRFLWLIVRGIFKVLAHAN